MNTEKKRLFLQEVFPDIHLDSIANMGDKERLKILLEQAERLLAIDDYGDTARLFAYNVVQTGEDDEIFTSPAFADDKSALGEWLVRLARLLAGVMDSDINLLFEACGMPVFTTNPIEVFPTDDKAVFPNGVTLFYDNILKMFSGIENKGIHLKTSIMRAICKRALFWSCHHNPVIQDYFAQELEAPDLKSIKDYENFSTTLMSVLLNIQNHLFFGKGKGLDGDAQFIIDALWGFVPHPYEDNFVACAKEIEKAAQSLLSEKGNDKDMKEYVNTILKKSAEIADEYEVDFDIQEWNISYSYLAYWIEFYYSSHVK